MKDYELFIAIMLILCIFFSWLYYQKARHAERLLLIEKGINPHDHANKENGFNFPWLRLGLVISGGCFGLAITIALRILKIVPSWQVGPVTIALVGLFGGIGLVIAHYIKKKN